MTVKVEKQLAGMQDFAIGNQKETQSRNGKPVDVNQISISYLFDNVQDAVAGDDSILVIGRYVSTGGYWTPGDGGGANYLVVAGGTGTHDGGSYIDLANGLQLKLIIFNNDVLVNTFGAMEGIADSAEPIRRASIFASTIRGRLLGTGTFTLSTSVLVNSGQACIEVFDNMIVNLDKLVLADGISAGVLASKSSNNLIIERLNIDGNGDNNPVSDHCVWFRDGYGMHIDTIEVFNAEGFGIRFNNINNLTFNMLKVENPVTIVSANDGVHFYDCSDIAGNTISTACGGDDSLAITCADEDISNIAIANVLCRSTNKGGPPTGGRGVLLNLVDGATSLKKMSNVSLPNIVAENYGNGAALLLQNGEFENVTASVTSFKCQNGLDINVGGGPGFPGTVTNCNFDITDTDSLSKSMSMSVINGASVTSNKLSLKTYNSGDNTGPVTVKGDKWEADIYVECDPHGTKSNPGTGIDIYGSNNTISATVFDAATGINFRVGASNNNIRLGTLSGNPVSMFINNSANNNNIVGGRLTTAITNNGAGSEISSVNGANSKGTHSEVTSTGIVVIPHGLVQAPTYVQSSMRGGNAYSIVYVSSDSTNMTFHIYTIPNGTLVTSGSVFMAWEASIF